MRADCKRLYERREPPRAVRLRLRRPRSHFEGGLRVRRRRGAPAGRRGGHTYIALLPDVVLQEVVEVSEPSRCTYQARPCLKQPVPRAPCACSPSRRPWSGMRAPAWRRRRPPEPPSDTPRRGGRAVAAVVAVGDKKNKAAAARTNSEGLSASSRRPAEPEQKAPSARARGWAHVRDRASPRRREGQGSQGVGQGRTSFAPFNVVHEPLHR